MINCSNIDEWRDSCDEQREYGLGERRKVQGVKLKSWKVEMLKRWKVLGPRLRPDPESSGRDFGGQARY